MLTYIFLAIYFVVLAYITYFASKNETKAEFLHGDKSLTANDSTWTTFASLLSGYNFVIGVTLSFIYGFWYLFAFIGLIAAFIVLYFFYTKRLLHAPSTHPLFSIGDYFSLVFGKAVGITINFILSLAILLFIILQLFVNTGLFSSLLHIHKVLALLLTAGIVTAYLWIGGFKASVKTDIFQGVLLLPIILIVAYLPFSLHTTTLHTVFDPSQIGFALGLMCLQFFSLLGQAESFQRIFASKDRESLKKGLTRACGMVLLVAGAIAYVGINLKAGGTTLDPNTLFTEVILTTVPSWLSSFLLVSLIAAFMGTIDSSMIALGLILSRLCNISENYKVRSLRLFMVMSILICSLASLYLTSFLSSVFGLISIISVIGASLLLALLFHVRTKEMQVFLLFGLVTFIIGTYFKIVNDNPLTSLIPVVTASASFLVMRLLGFGNVHASIRS